MPGNGQNGRDLLIPEMQVNNSVTRGAERARRRARPDHAVGQVRPEKCNSFCECTRTRLADVAANGRRRKCTAPKAALEGSQRRTSRLFFPDRLKSGRGSELQVK